MKGAKKTQVNDLFTFTCFREIRTPTVTSSNVMSKRMYHASYFGVDHFSEMREEFCRKLVPLDKTGKTELD